MKDNLLNFDKGNLSTYRSVVINTKLWHGMGRFAYVNGKIVDISELIIEQSSLQPVSDHYAALLGDDQAQIVDKLFGHSVTHISKLFKAVNSMIKWISLSLPDTTTVFS